MAESMVLMREGCHPFIFYHRVRPFLSAWKQNPTLPNGVLYRGVSNVRQQFYGGSAAQSALIPFLDIMLGINHKSTKSRIFLQAMREYMHKQHREFLGYVEQVACLREFVMAGVEFHLGGKGGKSKQEATGKKGDGDEGGDEDLTEEQQAWADLRTIYDLCVLGMKEFRSGHINVVAEYIVAQNQKGKTGGFEESAGGKGTGGTDLMKFLKPLRNNCHQATSTDFDFGGVCPMTGAVGECPAASFASGPSASVDDTATNATADDDNLSTYSEVSEMSEAASSVNARPRATSKTPEREGGSKESTEPSWARSPANPEESGRAAVKAAMLAASEAPVPEYVHVKDNAAKGEIDLYNTKIEHLERDNSAEDGQ
jgi:hypothetical protein